MTRGSVAADPDDKKLVTAEEVVVPGSGPKYAHPGSFSPVAAEKEVEDAEYTDVATAYAKGGAVAATPDSEGGVRKESAVRRRRKAKKRR